MNEPNDLPLDRICVSFSEAINWIAFRNFGGSVIGPQRMFSVLSEETPESELIHSGQEELANELLLNYAARGKIRLYAGSHTRYGPGKDETDRVVAVPPEFIENSYVDYEEAEGRPTLIENFDDEKKEYEHYSHIVVDYVDLTSNFWGVPENEHCPKQRPQDAVSPHVHERDEFFLTHFKMPTGKNHPVRSTRRGRPMKHKWSEFTAVTVEQCLLGPISLQEDLVRKMLEWCIEHWSEEPNLSDVRAYVAPIFQKFKARWSKGGATELAEKSESAADI